MKKFKLAVFIGRFQPFHKGHWWSLQQALKIAEKTVIVIGSVQEQGTKDNPWGFEERREMVERALEKLGEREKGSVAGIGEVRDYPRDKDWVEAVKKEVERLMGKVGDWSRVVVVGNNDWTNEVLKEFGGLSVWESGLYKREWYEGRKIREMMRRGDERWKERCFLDK